ncbi:hypothetical protein KSS87_003946 [Heliosperma pusillum]|nr:hypothetical protein KSS87_003946 [Heliosperma pusillum]
MCDRLILHEYMIHPSMAYMNKLVQFPSPFLKSPLSFPFALQLSSHYTFPPLHRPPLSLSSPSNSPNFLISTSLESDGSLVFKFGDASEIPIPPAEIEVELATQTDDYLAINQLQNNLDSEAALEDDQIEEDEGLKDEMIQLDVELPPLPLQAEPILDEEVNYVGLPSIAGQDDSPGGDITDAAFPSLEESVIISETIVNREAGLITLDEKIVQGSKFWFNDAVPSATLQSDDNPGSTDISEPAGPIPEFSATASEEAHLNGVQTSTVASSVPSAMASLPQATKVNDGITPSIQLSDADLPSEIFVAADPGSGISAAAEINLRVENSAPSLCVVSAAASVAHPAEALAGGDDAYFICDNWFGVADGVGQWSFGGIDKGLYAQELIQNCERLARKSRNTGFNSLKELLQESAARTESSGAARVLVAHIVDQVECYSETADLSRVACRYDTTPDTSSISRRATQIRDGSKGAYLTRSSQSCQIAAMFKHRAESSRGYGWRRRGFVEVLHVANIGDSGFIVVRNGTVFKKSSPMFHEFNFPHAVSFGENPVEAAEEYRVELEDGDIIVTATDGLFDNLYEREIASLVFKAVEDGKNVKDIAQLLASRSQEVGRSSHARTPFADAVQAAGHTEFRGGKFDHVTVIVSTVQKE